MTLSSIGLIQGRLFPKYIDQLQVFPDKTWKKEINILREIGFDYIELLWDKKKVLSKFGKFKINSYCIPKYKHIQFVWTVLHSKIHQIVLLMKLMM